MPRLKVAGYLEMATEGSRGCGYRKVGGLYLMGGQGFQTCDRLKLEIPSCPCCGEHPRPNRGIQPISSYELFDKHPSRIRDGEEKGKAPREDLCVDDLNCRVCYPNQRDDVFKDYLIWVGREYYTDESFNHEARTQGISRRIPYIPQELVMGHSVIYLAMRGNINTRAGVDRDGRPVKKNGIFMAYIPQRLDLLVWQSDADDDPAYIDELASRGITAVIIPDGDEDHAPSRRRANIPITFTAESGGEPQMSLLDFEEGL